MSLAHSDTEERRRPRALRRRGFTLLEIMAVVVIIGMLTALVGVQVAGQLERSRAATTKTKLVQLENALEMYKIDNSRYPTTEQGLEALVAPSTLDPEPRNFKQGGYLAETPMDPWGRPYLYLSPGENREVDIYSLGADGLPGGEGQNADIGNWNDAET